MQNYQATPDYYRDYIEHGWVKDAAAKIHKYIKRWRDAAGKWRYQYKESKSDGGRSTYVQLHPDEREDDRGYPSSRTQVDIKYGISNARNGRSHWAPVKGSSDYGNSRSWSKQGINRAISAGRKRVTRKGTKIKGYSGNLTSRGYSGSQGSGESRRLSNMGTRHAIKTPVNTLRSGNGITVHHKRRHEGYAEWRKNPQRYTAKISIRTGRVLGKSDPYASNVKKSRDLVNDMAKKRSARKNPYSPTYKTKYSYTETMNKWGNGRQKGYPSAKKATSPNSATNRDILRREINNIGVTPKRYKKTTKVNYSKRRKQHRYA